MSGPIGWDFEDIRVLPELPENCYFVPWTNITILPSKTAVANKAAAARDPEAEIKSKFRQLIKEDEKKHGSFSAKTEEKHKIPITISIPINPKFYGHGIVISAHTHHIHGCYLTQLTPIFHADTADEIHDANTKISTLHQKLIDHRHLRPRPTTPQHEEGTQTPINVRKQWRSKIKDQETEIEKLQVSLHDRRPKRIAWHAPHTCFVVDRQEMADRGVKVEDVGFGYEEVFWEFREMAGELFNSVEDCPVFFREKYEEVEGVGSEEDEEEEISDTAKKEGEDGGGEEERDCGWLSGRRMRPRVSRKIF